MNALAWMSLAIAVSTLLGLIAAGIAWLYKRVLKPLILLIEDWAGRPGRPGVPAQPGVMERLQQWEDRQAALSLRVRALEEWRDALESLRANGFIVRSTDPPK